MPVLCGVFSIQGVLGDAHVINVEDLIKGPKWTFAALEKLDIEAQALSGLCVNEHQTFHRSLGYGCSSLDEDHGTEASKEQVFLNLARLEKLVEIKFGLDEVVFRSSLLVQYLAQGRHFSISQRILISETTKWTPPNRRAIRPHH